ncbi:hypothetical protein [Phytoactinopolyspora limicola]|uniref:hypothetical protein n=1 Tax=Phytoactinopolyspora limicola TaxID=2715536 RepID=UPI001A9C72BF|nr:hypothetical protein [Phytoactinopolyspora limicola]
MGTQDKAGPADADRGATRFAVRRQQPIPEEISSLCTLAKVDYVDVFTLSWPRMNSWSPEQWARAMLGDVPDRAEIFIWRVLLRLQLASGVSADHVAGWAIADRGDDWLRLEAESWFIRSQLVVRVGADDISLATFVYYDRIPAALLWRPMSAVHRRLAPGLLLGAYRTLTGRLASGE